MPSGPPSEGRSSPRGRRTSAPALSIWPSTRRISRSVRGSSSRRSSSVRGVARRSASSVSLIVGSASNARASTTCSATCAPLKPSASRRRRTSSTWRVPSMRMEDIGSRCGAACGEALPGANWKAPSRSPSRRMTAFMPSVRRNIASTTSPSARRSSPPPVPVVTLRVPVFLPIDRSCRRSGSGICARSPRTSPAPAAGLSAGALATIALVTASTTAATRTSSLASMRRDGHLGHVPGKRRATPRAPPRPGRWSRGRGRR